jgi:hypothetical protein
LQGPIAQIAALTIYGNERLAGHARKGFWPGASVFKFCKDVRFVTFAGDPSAVIETICADDPVQWMDSLACDGVQRLRLRHLPGNHPLMSDRLSVAFAGGGGRWLIEAVRGSRAAPLVDRWEAKWSIGDRKDPERKIWSVAYGRVESGVAPLAQNERPLAMLKAELDAALTRTQSFAAAKELEGFAAAFHEAGRALSSPMPLSDRFHADIAPSTLPLEAKQLLAAAEIGWVFGGMGSWNDLGFKGEEGREYEQLSDHLFDLLIEAICVAANTSAELVPA